MTKYEKQYRPKKYDALPEVFLSDRQASAAASRMVKAGMARKIGPRLYTRNVLDAPEDVVSRNLWPLVALLAPGAVVSHRTAFENRPAPDGSVFLSGSLPTPDRPARHHPSGRSGRQRPGRAGDMPYMQARSTWPHAPAPSWRTCCRPGAKGHWSQGPSAGRASSSDWPKSLRVGGRGGAEPAAG